MKTKVLTILLLVVVALSIIPFSVNAATATISVESKSINAGEEVKVEMKLTGSFSAESITETIKFDNTKLEVKNVEWGDILENARGFVECTEVAPANSVGEVVATVAASKAQTYSTGTIVTVTFKAKAGATGNQALSLTSVIDGKNNVVTSKSGNINVVVPVTGVKLDKTTANLDLKGTVTLAATVEPANTTTDKTVTWSSSDNTVATVKNGVVTAVKEGTVTITATVGGKVASCTVTVKCAHASKTEHPAKEATCLTKGNTAYTTCNVCGRIIAGENKEIPVKDHTYGDLIAEVPMVHTKDELKDGTAAHYKCSVCNKLFNKDKKEVKAEDLVIKAEHKYEELEITEETHSAKCACGKVIENEKHKGGTAYCKEQAICEVCKAHYGELNPDNHKGGEATCVAKAVCELCNEEYGEINPDNHKNTELQGQVEATTEKEGYTGDVYCKDCEKVVEKGEVIAKLEKEPVKDENKDPNKPNTGDNSNIILWISLSVISIAGVIYIVKHNSKIGKRSN